MHDLLRRSQANRRRPPIHLRLRPCLPRTLVCASPFKSVCIRNWILVQRESWNVSLFFAKSSLQQWFEYCANKKKNSCPVCKQTCSLNGVNRLYFQSIGDASDPTLSQKPLNIEEDPGALRREVKRLEVKVAGLTSVLERNQKDLKELNEEVSDLCCCCFFFFFKLLFLSGWLRRRCRVWLERLKLSYVENDSVLKTATEITEWKEIFLFHSSHISSSTKKRVLFEGFGLVGKCDKRKKKGLKLIIYNLQNSGLQ